ncbi:HD domain protein [Cordyceps fumosorosea ARSEF 2679]|uniref:HD domain protein n=1 Tax=Cordyceps fumosorosea (strain ARSEF 2679) TaxID=1081104 RepID=A0A168CIY5_CORFA|nr:HD domain protein [Cordyceps fumosorosea ARSEF 2679]OAA71435.1 HD domain protein [Cordyceps fumosorosea ARSEF 2679]
MEALSKILQAARGASGAQKLPETDQVFGSVARSVQEHMAGFDASHDFNHVLRVVALAQSIMAAESKGDDAPHPSVDPVIVILAALLHDVTDKKYAEGAAWDSKLTRILGDAGVDVQGPLATAVVTVVNNVSYSTEVRDPSHTLSILATHPELGIVQDADRLDAIGAVGIGRAFTFGGAKMPLADMQLSRDHMTEKLGKLESMMKTNTGRRLAKERTQRILTFSKWWDEEIQLY